MVHELLRCVGVVHQIAYKPNFFINRSSSIIGNNHGGSNLGVLVIGFRISVIHNNKVRLKLGNLLQRRRCPHIDHICLELLQKLASSPPGQIRSYGLYAHR
ncbi:hypothetical protein D3C78_1083680 [compost metagenome]